MQTIDDFAALHRADDPLVLFNVWDAGSGCGRQGSQGHRHGQPLACGGTGL